MKQGVENIMSITNEESLHSENVLANSQTSLDRILMGTAYASARI